MFNFLFTPWQFGEKRPFPPKLAPYRPLCYSLSRKSSEQNGRFAPFIDLTPYFLLQVILGCHQLRKPLQPQFSGKSDGLFLCQFVVNVQTTTCNSV